LFKRHPKTIVIWAHLGVGRIIRPVKAQGALVEELIKDPALSNLHFDISWDEVAKYAVATPESAQSVAGMIERYPERFLFGTDEVAPRDQGAYLRVYNQYEPMLKLLSSNARDKLLKGNYERIFDAARLKVRSWEKAH
jgi:predicted TIM-barrel fold metal-dependent hydrolase